MKRRTYVLWKKLLLRALIVFIVLGLLSIYFFTGAFVIQKYVFVGVPEERIETLETQVSYASLNKLFFVLPGNRVLSYQDDKIREAVTDMLPNTKKIRIYPTGLHTLTVKLESHVPVFSVSDTHAISKDGTVYKEIAPLESFPRLEISTSTEVTPETLERISTLIEKIDTVLFEIRHIEIDVHDDIYLYNEGKESYLVLSNNSDMNMVWSNVLSAIDTDPLKSKLAADKGQLKYLDARFGNKIFYKFTNEQTTDIIPEHEADNMATTTVAN